MLCNYIGLWAEFPARDFSSPGALPLLSEWENHVKNSPTICGHFSLIISAAISLSFSLSPSLSLRLSLSSLPLSRQDRGPSAAARQARGSSAAARQARGERRG